MPLKLLFFMVLGLGQALFAVGGAEYLPEKRALFFRELSTPFMQMVETKSPYFEEDQETEIWLLRLLHFISDSPLLRNAPTGEPAGYSEKCRPEHLLGEVQGQGPLQFADLALRLQQHVESCRSDMETGWNDILSNVIGAMTISMDPSRHPFARHVIFNLPNNIKLKGLLAMKTDGKKRPLIIFRTGIFSNTQAFIPERYLFMQAFEQSPFNVLVLESLSGAEFVKHNSSLSMGGFDEGIQNFLIARELQNSSQPISKLIDSVHLMGMSMGAHGILFASLLNELNPDIGGLPIIKSALTYCPLLNMRDTLDYHLSQGFTMDIMNFWAARRIPGLKSHYPDLDPSNFVGSVLKKIEAGYQGPLVGETGIRLPPSELGFWQRNNFWSGYQNVKTPVLIFATRKDPIVSWFINSGRIEDGRMKFPDSNLKMIPLEQGYHCSLPVAYDWSQQATLLQTYFLNFSPQFHLSSREFRSPLSKEVIEHIKNTKTELIVKTKFEVPVGSAALTARVRFQKVLRPGYFEALAEPQMEIQLPLSEMEFPIESVVASGYESELLRRWAYQNISATVSGSDLVLKWKITP